MVSETTLIGFLGKDPEVRNLESGAKVATFSIATSHDRKNKSGEWEKITTWHNIVAWSHNANYAERFLKKSSKVYIKGRIANSEYEKDGVKKYKSEIVVERLKGMDSRDSNNTQSTPQLESATSGGTTKEEPDSLPF